MLAVECPYIQQLLIETPDVGFFVDDTRHWWISYQLVVQSRNKPAFAFASTFAQASAFAKATADCVGGQVGGQKGSPC